MILTPAANLLLYEWIVSTTGQFTRNIKGPSNIPTQVLWVAALKGRPGVLCSSILLSYTFLRCQVHEDHDRLWPHPHSLWSSLRTAACGINGELFVCLLIDKNCFALIDVVYLCRSGCLNYVIFGSSTYHIQWWLVNCDAAYIICNLPNFHRGSFSHVPSWNGVNGKKHPGYPSWDLHIYHLWSFHPVSYIFHLGPGDPW